MTSLESYFYRAPYHPFNSPKEKIIEDLSKLDVPLDIEDYYQAWAEHDGLHFLTDTPLTKQGERIIASYEKYFNCGWRVKGSQYTGFYKPFEFYEIPEDLTIQRILETAEDIRNLFDVARGVTSETDTSPLTPNW